MYAIISLTYAVYVNDHPANFQEFMMSNPYRDIFRKPGTLGFASAGFLARLPIAMVPMGIVAMLSQTHGEYWLAGAVSATFAFTNALISPQVSRLVDRLGQATVLIPATIISVL